MDAWTHIKPTRHHQKPTTYNLEFKLPSPFNLQFQLVVYKLKHTTTTQRATTNKQQHKNKQLKIQKSKMQKSNKGKAGKPPLVAACGRALAAAGTE
jgi:hypothetical protein